MESKLQKLTIDSSGKHSTGKKQAVPVADSWEEDDSNSNSGTDGADDTTTTASDKKSSMPGPPPPTPSSPRGNFPRWDAIDTSSYGIPSSRGSGTPASREDTPRRQEKSTAVASRLIAAGLGVKAPKRTEEQKAFDRAAKEKEIKRRNREKDVAAQQREEDERAKAAVWE